MSELIACHHKVTLDIAKRDVCTIEVVNRDTANILEVNVCENGKEVSLENATLVTITYSNDTVDEMQISEDFKTAFIRINANCLKRGINFAKVCIYSGDNGLITAEMLTINCKQTVGSDNPAVPDPDMPKLKEMIEDAVAQAGGAAGLKPLVGTTQTITPSQVLAAIKEGRDIALQYTDSYYGVFVFSAFNANEKLGIVVSNSILPQMNGLTGTLLGFVDDAGWVFKATNTATKDDVGTAVNEALTAAKASGEFDGITPTIGDNGNWYLGTTDTGKPSRGEKGDTGANGPQGPKGDTGATGADGKSAYSYAVDGGYTGTEAEFAAKLAEETGTVPENVALLEDVTADEASGDFIPMLSQNGTEYRLSIGDDGVPAIKNVNGVTVWSGTSGGSSGGGGDPGGDNPGSDTPTGEWVSGAEVAYTLVDGEWAKVDGSFVPYDGYSRTDFIYCYGAGHIYHSCSGNYSINIIFYGIDKKFVSCHDGYDAWTAIPENVAYVVMSFKTEKMTGSVIKLYKKVEPTWTDGEPYKFTLIENEYVNPSSGEFVAYSGWKRTDYVNCAGAIKITKTNASANSQYGAFYNAEKEYMDAMKTPDTTGGTSADITVPVGACYFVTSDYNANMDALVLIPYA